MAEVFSTLVDRVRERFPTLDVRTDQCEIVRIYAKGFVVGIRQQGDKFKAEFISLRHECDFETTVTRTVITSDFTEFESQLLKALEVIV